MLFRCAVVLVVVCCVCGVCVVCVVCCIVHSPHFPPVNAPPPDNPLRDRPSTGLVPPDPPVCVCCVCLVQDLCAPPALFPGPPLRRTPPPDRPKFRAFFFPSPPQNSFFSTLYGCLLVEFWWCFEDRNPEMCTFGLSGVKPRRPHQTGPPWIAHDSPRTPNGHI